MSKPIFSIDYRYISDPPLARCMGWTKKHLHLQCFVVGKWRSMGFYTPAQMERRAWQDKAFATLQTNGGIPRDYERHDVTFVNCSTIPLP